MDTKITIIFLFFSLLVSVENNNFFSNTEPECLGCVFEFDAQNGRCSNDFSQKCIDLLVNTNGSKKCYFWSINEGDGVLYNTDEYVTICTDFRENFHFSGLTYNEDGVFSGTFVYDRYPSAPFSQEQCACEIDVAFDENKAICIGEEIELIPTITGFEGCISPEGLDYEWSTGETTPTITVSPAVRSTYSVTVLCNDFCSASASLEVSVIDFGSYEICSDGADEIVFSSEAFANSVIWYNDQDEEIGTGTDITVNSDLLGLEDNNVSIYYTAIDDDGCVGSACCPIQIDLINCCPSNCGTATVQINNN